MAVYESKPRLAPGEFLATCQRGHDLVEFRDRTEFERHVKEHNAGAYAQTGFRGASSNKFGPAPRPTPVVKAERWGAKKPLPLPVEVSFGKSEAVQWTYGHEVGNPLPASRKGLVVRRGTGGTAWAVVPGEYEHVYVIHDEDAVSSRFGRRGRWFAEVGVLEHEWRLAP